MLCLQRGYLISCRRPLCSPSNDCHQAQVCCCQAKDSPQGASWFSLLSPQTPIQARSVPQAQTPFSALLQLSAAPGCLGTPEPSPALLRLRLHFPTPKWCFPASLQPNTCLAWSGISTVKLLTFCLPKRKDGHSQGKINSAHGRVWDVSS